MRAVRIHSHGGPEVLQLDEIPEPAPGPGDLLVRLRATSVNHRDVWIRRGHPHPAYQVDLPAVLGIDVCGDVVEVGSEVDGFRVGDRVTANPYMQCGTCRYCMRGELPAVPRLRRLPRHVRRAVPRARAVRGERRPVGSRRARRRLPERLYHRLADARRQGTAWTRPTRCSSGPARAGSAGLRSRSRS